GYPDSKTTCRSISFARDTFPNQIFDPDDSPEILLIAIRLLTSLFLLDQGIASVRI
ncbi:hypothetical protein TNIN_281371, partial [Trichonephila inaurata madagascariensis]